MKGGNNRPEVSRHQAPRVNPYSMYFAVSPFSSILFSSQAKKLSMATIIRLQNKISLSPEDKRIGLNFRPTGRGF
jgi:hypothetical protein